jgi:hypothetical protein
LAIKPNTNDNELATSDDSLFDPIGLKTKAWHIDESISSILIPTLYRFIYSFGFTNVLLFHSTLFSCSIGSLVSPIKSSLYKRWKCKLFIEAPPPIELYATLDYQKNT